MTTIDFHKKEIRAKRLYIPVTQNEHQKIMMFCEENNLKLSVLIRHLLKEYLKLQ